MKQIQLSRPGFVAIVDDCDFDRLSLLKWHVRKGRATFYAQAHVYRDGRRTTAHMHKMVLDCPPNHQIDHRNGDGLDNQRENLRIATVQQNQANRGKPLVNGSSLFKGVSKNDRGKWRASIFVQGKTIRVGDFLTEEEAARAYDAAASKYFGEFARPNFEKSD